MKLAKEQCIKAKVIDLRHYRCPQFFVQFKWQLKNSPDKKVLFVCTDEQDLSDIKRYLCNNSYHCTFFEEGNLNYIEVYITDV
ncbi:sulfurtransferase TusA family protein [Pseudoalteromonas umbrosa]|uniref:sulfurtransferase TusA family protein n=1 Tax=Pseudoalteromonas umbrosa TaxID=3048489 RepID=UPI0024C45CD0|nr:sulfurtransferase TusA family protein [Pseudoalteromonas sp. B95]MDK1286025.1 sulfurtransferase TusA family protein [Pseudoalteromonas sp. B95]